LYLTFSLSLFTARCWNYRAIYVMISYVFFLVAFTLPLYSIPRHVATKKFQIMNSKNLKSEWQHFSEKMLPSAAVDYQPVLV